ncbi:Retrovirus-related Pol polyprotein from transposon 17.6 [Stylophora pistillata]|uniref:Retrovirus-related Pol polyprotein from transposon 17.6 n=1 Tax=Stylophora pistillata TaxID=50429 RepID=A0A2B4RRR7_STYPI|nr:Retrovirus-related Pol polyprotein from transposon 17.6 [Stylophora pistillata]
MGYRLTNKGLQPDPSKAAAITGMPTPGHKATLQRFLGMCQYLSKFCQNLSQTVLPLRDLTRDDTEFLWSEVHEAAFNSAKTLIASTTVLRYYDVGLPVTLQLDAFDIAIGGGLLQEGHPVCFTSHTLSATEKNYAQIEKECVAIESCMEKWHHYLYGKHDIMVHSDHQPLETIFTKPLSRALRRLQRMMLRLQNYHFTFQYKKRKELFVADTLSCTPRSDGSQSPSRMTQEYDVFRVDLKQMNLSPNLVKSGNMVSTKTAGLAFSGGGIRSAALCSGVLRRLLQSKAKVDYLSCVSGGGYTGTAFLDWKYRKEKKAKGREEWHKEFFENMRQRAGYFCNWEKPCQGILDTIVFFFLVLTVTFIEPIVICGSYAFPVAFIIDYLFGKLLRAKVDCDHVAATSSPSNPNATAQKILEHCLSRQGTVAFNKITLFSVLVVIVVIFYILSQKLSKKKSKYFRLFSIISFLFLSLTFLPFAINDFYIQIPLWSQAFIVVIGWVLWFVLPLLREKTSFGILIYLYSYIIYWKVYEAKIVGVLFSIELFNKLLFASGFIIWFVPYLAQSRRRLVHVFNRWKLQKAFYSKESLAAKGWLEILQDVFCPLWTCLGMKQKKGFCHRDKRGSFDTSASGIDPAQKRSLNLADLSGMEPEYISNMTVHNWKENANFDTDDDVLTISPTTIERLDRDPSTADPFKYQRSPEDIELSYAMATSAAAISGYVDNLQVFHLSTFLGLEMGASMISNLEAIKNESRFMKLLPILINILRGLPLIAVPAVYYNEGDESSIKAGVFTFFIIHLVLAFIGTLADTGAQNPNLWEKIGRWFIVHVSFVRFVREGLSIDNIGRMPPPVMLLSDGGHVENLGILPLLKKQLKKVIVVDGGSYSNENEYGEDLLKALMLARRDLSCSFLGQGGRDVISDLLENFVKLPRPQGRKKKEEKKPRHFKYVSM